MGLENYPGSDLPMPSVSLTVPLDDERKERLGRVIKQEIDRYRDETAGRRANAARWRGDFELFPPPPSRRWRNSAAVCSPLTQIYCQSHWTRLNQQIAKAEPPFVVYARTSQAIDAAPQVEEVLAAVLEEADWQSVANQIHAELPVVGNVFLRVSYEQDVVRVPTFQYDFDEDQYELLSSGGMQSDQAFLAAMRRGADGMPSMTVGFENRIKHEGVKFRVIPFEDGVILPSTIRDPEEAYGIGERLMIRGDELLAGARVGRYDREAVEALLQRSSDEQPDERADRLMHQGIMPDAGGLLADLTPLYRQYLCYEICWLDDLNDDGEQEWVIVTLHYDTERVLRVQWMPYEHGRPYYTLFRYYTRPRELFGMSVAERIASIQDAATAVLCQIIDHGDLVINLHGNFFYDGTSGFDPDKAIAQLGKPIRVDNVDGIKMIELAQLPAEHYQVYSMLKEMADLITATSNPTLGRTTEAEKTLGEIQIVAGASNMIFEEVASIVARDWAKVADQVRWLTGQFGEGGEVQYRVSAKPGKLVADPMSGQAQPAAMVQGQYVAAPGGFAFASIPAEILMEEVDLVPAGLKQLSDMQSRMQLATIIQNTALMHPLLAQNYPALAIILDEFLQAANWGKREKVMAEVQKQLDAFYMQQQLQAMMGMAMPGALGIGPGGPGGPAGLGGPPGSPGGPQSAPSPPGGGTPTPHGRVPPPPRPEAEMQRGAPAPA